MRVEDDCALLVRLSLSKRLASRSPGCPSQEWLEKVGSPGSRIDKCIFTNEIDLEEVTYPDFGIRR